jgi:hypothetical protein
MTAIMQRRILFISIAAALAFCAAFCGQSYRESRRRLETISAETILCRQLAVSIEQVRQSDDVPVQADLPQEQLYQRLHEAAQAAGFDDGSAIRSIHPQPAHPMRGGSFQEKDVELSLQGLTLEQVVRFLHHLCTANPQLKIAAITLHEPKGLGAATVWTADPVTLTYRLNP